MSNESIHVHKLTGCSPSPLGHYLKALGILRLVSEQVDPIARGWWRHDVFHLGTRLDRDELESFLLNDYAPTPMTAPWLPRSGYADVSSHRKTREMLEELVNCTNDRFDEFRQVKELLTQYALDQSLDVADAGSLRSEEVIQFARVHGMRSFCDWVDSCLVFSGDKPSYPAIFGTGGNEGSGSYLANFYVALVAALIKRLESPEFALWNAGASSSELQVFLGRKNFNAGHFSESSGNDSPWNYILALEGVLVLGTRASTRWNSKQAEPARGTGASLSAPFAVGNSTAGYSSAESKDSLSRQSGSLISGRGEQWFPIWFQPSSLREVRELFRHGRVLSDKRGNVAKRSAELMRGVARFAVSRGVHSFYRFGYLQRNGDNHMAVPLGRFEVRERKHQDLLDEVDEWIERLRELAGKKNAPESFDRVHRACEEALIECTQRDEPQSFSRLLETIGAAEDQMLRSPKFAAKNYAAPAPVLSPRWGRLILDCEDSPALRLAIALVAQYGPLQSNQPGPLPTIRDHWVPLAGRQFDKGESGLNLGPNQCGTGFDFKRALVAVVQRRLLALGRGAAMKGDDHSRFLPLRLTHHRLGARLSDIEAFLQRRVDDGRLLSLARGLMSVRWPKPSSDESDNDPSRDPLGGLATFGVLRLALPTGPVALSATDQHAVRINSTVFHRLRVGDLSLAIDLATRQLSAAGLRPRVRIAIGSSDYARRLAAAMAFGLSDQTYARLARGLTQPEIPQTRRRQMEADVMT